MRVSADMRFAMLQVLCVDHRRLHPLLQDGVYADRALHQLPEKIAKWGCTAAWHVSALGRLKDFWARWGSADTGWRRQPPFARATVDSLLVEVVCLKSPLIRSWRLLN